MVVPPAGWLIVAVLSIYSFTDGGIVCVVWSIYDRRVKLGIGGEREKGRPNGRILSYSLVRFLCILSLLLFFFSFFFLITVLLVQRLFSSSLSSAFYSTISVWVVRRAAADLWSKALWAQLVTFFLVSDRVYWTWRVQAMKKERKKEKKKKKGEISSGTDGMYDATRYRKEKKTTKK